MRNTIKNTSRNKLSKGEDFLEKIAIIRRERKIVNVGHVEKLVIMQVSVKIRTIIS